MKLSQPHLSIIIPTFNRAGHLNETLKRLHEQSLSKEFYDIWVVNDGSTDSTRKLLEIWTQKSPLVHALHQKNSGQGTARNHALKAIKKAERKQGSGKNRIELILFIGDDIYGTKDFLKEHVEFHQKHPEENTACLGLTEWDSSEPVTEFMKWLVTGGPQFAYHRLHAEQELSFWYFYTSNVSLKKSLLKNAHFDEDFKTYGWEDVELAYRLQTKHHLKLIYQPKALAFHNHFMKEEDLAKKNVEHRKNGTPLSKKTPHCKSASSRGKTYFLKINFFQNQSRIFTFISAYFG